MLDYWTGVWYIIIKEREKGMRKPTEQWVDERHAIGSLFGLTALKKIKKNKKVLDKPNQIEYNKIKDKGTEKEREIKMKEMIKKALVDGYKEIAYTDKYIYGFFDKKVVYVVFSDDSTLDAVTKLDTSSDKTGYSLRFTPNKFQKEILKMGGKYFPLCSKEFFLNECKKSIYNKGRVFEKMVTEYYGQEWGWDKVPFTEAGDIEIDGVVYQIKFEKATYTTEKRLARLRKKKMEKMNKELDK